MPIANVKNKIEGAADEQSCALSQPAIDAIASGDAVPVLSPSASCTELENTGPDADVVAACVTEAAARLASPGRPPQFNAVKSGANSVALWDALSEAKAVLVAQVCADLGLDGDDAPTVKRRLVDSYVEASLLRESMFALLVTRGGPVTGKGNVRATLTAWSTAVDRESRLAQTIGLERKARKVQSLAEALSE